MIKLLVLDFDGVLTDNNVYLNENGEESVRCSRSDSIAINDFKRDNIDVIVITTEQNSVAKKRCDKLKILCFVEKDKTKLEILQYYMKQNNFEIYNVAYVGNDVNDFECLKFVGCPFIVKDATDQLRQKLYPTLVYNISEPHFQDTFIDVYELRNNGGNGVVREVYDLIKAYNIEHE